MAVDKDTFQITITIMSMFNHMIKKFRVYLVLN